MKRYKQINKLVAFIKPTSIIEIGTHWGTRADLICREALKYNEKVHYIGYDLFEEADEETNKREMNGKGAGSQELAKAVMEHLQKEFPGFTYELVPGDTRKTLHGTEQRADFVFIDGGHSVETIKGDYEAVKGSRVILFDDYYTAAGDLINEFGCNRILEGVQHEVLPVEDRIKNGIGVRLAVVGYSSKWEAAINRVIKKDGHRTISIWRGSSVEPADLVCVLNGLDDLFEVDEALERIRRVTQKRLFFVIKASALRPLTEWRTIMERYFQILEWFAPNGDEVVGTAMPLLLVGEWNSKGVMADDERFDNIAHNVKITPNRVRPTLTESGEIIAHGRKAIIVGFGPSLKDTWPQIIAEKNLTPGDADIITMSGSHDYLQRRGIVPDYHVECDPRPHKAENLAEPNDTTKYYIASCCHPDLTDKLKDRNLWFWHLMNGTESYRIGEELESEKNEVMIAGGGSVGLRSIALFYTLGYRNFAIYGMDCSFASEDEQWAGRHKGKKKNAIKVKCGDRWFLTSPVDVTYTRHFIDTIQRSEGAEFTLYGDGLLQEMCKHMKQEKAA